MPEVDPERLDVVAVEVQGDVAEAVNVEKRRLERTVRNEGLGKVQADEAFRVDRRAELLERDAGREVRGGRAEEVASVECPRDRVECVRRIRELVRGLDARATRRRQQEAVVRADVHAAVGVSERERPPRPADTGVDDREVDADGHEADRVRQDERALEHRRRRDPVRDVDDLRLRRDPLDNAVARADEVVLQPEIAQERDEHAAERNAARSCGATCALGRRGAQRRTVLRRASPHRRTPRGLIRTKAVGAWSGRGLVTTSAA